MNPDALLTLRVHAYGNAHQLASILEQAAKDIRSCESQSQPFPWFHVANGSASWDWRVSKVSDLPEHTTQ